MIWARDGEEYEEAQQAEHIAELVEQIWPILSAYDPDVQGAVMTELTGLWLASYKHMPRDTTVMRAKLLALHVKMVRQIVKQIDLRRAKRTN